MPVSLLALLSSSSDLHNSDPSKAVRYVLIRGQVILWGWSVESSPTRHGVNQALCKWKEEFERDLCTLCDKITTLRTLMNGR